jgi:hypothetical protein
MMGAMASKWYTVVADVEGDEFCVLTAREQ